MNYSKPRKVAIYARVSTSNQTVENQFQELREVANKTAGKSLLNCLIVASQAQKAEISDRLLINF